MNLRREKCGLMTISTPAMGTRSHMHLAPMPFHRRAVQDLCQLKIFGHVFLRRIGLYAVPAIYRLDRVCLPPIRRADPGPTVAHLLVMHLRAIDWGAQTENRRRQPA